jgi:hypothetical protein
VGFIVREDNLIINPQMWLLKKKLVKKKKSYKIFMIYLFVLFFIVSLLGINHIFTNNGSQMSSVERLNEGFITGSNLFPFSCIWLSERDYG